MNDTAELRRPKFLSYGAVGIVWKVTESIVVKRPLDNDDPRVRDEYRVFDMLESHPPCPCLVQSFLRLPTANFLQFLCGGTLDARLRARQIRDSMTGQVLKVEAIEPQHLIIRWMRELSHAAAWLESLGYAHGDIRPPNILLDHEDHLKLTDFDSTAPVGAVHEGCAPPWARVLGEEGGKDRGTFGYHGPRTEQFAIGSVFYYVTRGYEPYDNDWFGREHGCKTVALLRTMAFPSTEDSTIDTIIRNCWHGKFHTVRCLEEEVKSLNGGEDCLPKILPTEEFGFKQDECRELVASGLLDMQGTC